MGKKIGIFTGFYLPHLGGVERYTDKLAAELIKLGYEVVIVTSNHSELKDVERHKGIKIYRLPILEMAKNRYPIPRMGARYRQLKGAIDKENLDVFIVNTRFHLTSLIGARIGKKKQKPVMLIEHGTDHFSVNNRFLDFFGAIYEHMLTFVLKRYITRYYGVSQNCNKWLAHFSIKADGVFYNAINSADESIATNSYIKKYPKHEIVVTYAGRLIKEKGILNLMDAFEKLGMDNTRLVVAGDGELMSDVREKYKAKNIDIVGKLDFKQIMSLYKRTDIFVYPSLYPEGLPTSILEAALMECAIVATPRGGTEEVIVDSDHGTIVDGTTESLYSALHRLVEDGSVRERQAKKAKRRVKIHFEWRGVAKKVDEEIKELEVSRHGKD